MFKLRLRNLWFNLTLCFRPSLRKWLRDCEKHMNEISVNDVLYTLMVCGQQPTATEVRESEKRFYARKDVCELRDAITRMQTEKYKVNRNKLINWLSDTTVGGEINPSEIVKAIIRKEEKRIADYYVKP